MEQPIGDIEDLAGVVASPHRLAVSGEERQKGDGDSKMGHRKRHTISYCRMVKFAGLYTGLSAARNETRGGMGTHGKGATGKSHNATAARRRVMNRNKKPGMGARRWGEQPQKDKYSASRRTMAGRDISNKIHARRVSDPYQRRRNLINLVNRMDTLRASLAEQARTEFKTSRRGHNDRWMKPTRGSYKLRYGAESKKRHWKLNWNRQRQGKGWSRVSMVKGIRTEEAEPPRYPQPAILAQIGGLNVEALLDTGARLNLMHYDL